MRIFVEVPWREGLKQQWGGQNLPYLVILVAIPLEPLQLKPILLCVFMDCIIGFMAGMLADEHASVAV